MWPVALLGMHVITAPAHVVGSAVLDDVVPARVGREDEVQGCVDGVYGGRFGAFGEADHTGIWLHSGVESRKKSRVPETFGESRTSL